MRARLNNNVAQMAAVDSGSMPPEKTGEHVLLPPAAGPLRLEPQPWTTRRQVLTVMFVDIRGSSKISEALSPDLTVEFFNVYLGLAAQAILANNGGVNQFIGDGVLATFGLLGEADHGASNAIAASAAIHRAFADAKGRSGFPDRVRAVVAIHTGTAIVSAVGRGESLHYQVLGTAVNIASRLETEGKELGLSTVLSGSTVAALKGGATSFRLVSRKKLRGLSERVEIWSPDALGSGDSVRASSIARVGRNAAAPSDGAGAMQPKWKPLAIGSLIASAVIASVIAVAWLRSGDVQFTSTLMTLLQVAVAIAAAVTCRWRASRSERPRRRGWTLISASAAAWALGQTESGLLGLGAGIAPPSAWIADVSFMASLALAIAGALSFWTSPLGPFGRLRAVLDGLIVAASLTFALWALGLDQLHRLPALMRLSEVTDEVQFSIGEIALATVVILVINRGARHLQGPLLLLLASVGVGAAAAVFGAYEIKAPDGGGFVADAGLVLALLVLVLAPLWPASPPVMTPEDSADAWQLALPWMAVLLASVSSVIQLLQGEGIDRFLTVLAAIFGALLAASQFLAHKDSLVLLRKSRLSEKTLADVIGRAPVGIARVSTQLRILAANPSLGVLLRDPPDVLAGSTIVKYLPADVQPHMREALAALASGEHEIIESEIPLVRADGTRAWVHLTSTAVKKPTGPVDYFLAMMQDITERHEAEQASSASLTELERLNQVKTEFLQSISHEFRTALIGIEGFSELMQEGTDISPHEVKEFARDIHTGAERMNQMLTEFLDLDHVEKSSAPITLGSVDMNTVIRREIERIELGTDGLTFTAMLDPSLPLIVGDQSQFAQLARLLLSNAVRYSPDGGQILVATRTHVGQLEVSVRDQGAGMRADFDNPLFDSDDLYAKNPIRRVVGTSLGLGMARKIVALHGGRIWMDRLDGIGFEAHVTFPLDRVAPNANAQSASAQAT